MVVMLTLTMLKILNYAKTSRLKILHTDTLYGSQKFLYLHCLQKSKLAKFKIRVMKQFNLMFNFSSDKGLVSSCTLTQFS